MSKNGTTDKDSTQGIMPERIAAGLEYFKEMGVTGVYRSTPPSPSPDPSTGLRTGAGEGTSNAPSFVRRGKGEVDPTSQLQKIRADIGDCQRCKLCKDRTNIVFGVGNPAARLMFVGEGPGRDEDLQGEPFVGRAGQLLTKIIEAMGLSREQVYIGNVVECRPPDNRLPEPDEVATCFPFLYRQIEAIRPQIIVTLGSLATQTLLGTKTGITALRGKFTTMKGLGFGGAGMEDIRVLPTFHPAYLLRNPPMKKVVWEDMKQVIEALRS